MNCRLKPVLISGHAHCFEPSCKCSGIAILAARRDVRTPGHGIPGVLRPFDLATHAVACYKWFLFCSLELLVVRRNRLFALQWSSPTSPHPISDCRRRSQIGGTLKGAPVNADSCREHKWCAIITARVAIASAPPSNLKPFEYLSAWSTAAEMFFFRRFASTTPMS